MGRPPKLSDAQVADIRAAYKQPCPHCGHRTTMRELAKRHGVTDVAIHKIIHNVNHRV